MKKKRLLVIGPGKIAVQHTKAFIKAGFELGSLFASKRESSTLKNYKKIFNVNNKNIYFNFRKINSDFIKQNKIDAILLTATLDKLVTILKVLVGLKTPILVEKPVGIGTSWYNEFKNKKTDNIIVGFNRRFYRNVQYIKNIISKNYSKIDNLHVSIPEKVFFDKKNHKQIYQRYYSNTAHMIDLLFYLFGDFKIISRFYSNKKFKKNFFAIITNKKINGIIDFSFNSPKNFSISFELKKKRYYLKPIEVLNVYDKLKISHPTKNFPLRTYEPLQIKRLFSYDKDHIIKPGFYSQAIEIKKYLNKKKFSSNVARLNDANKVQNFLSKLIKKYN